MKTLFDRLFWPLMIGTLFVGAALLAIAPEARGDCATVTHATHATKAVVVTKEVAVAVPTVTLVTVPLYTAVYVPAYQPPAPVQPVAPPPVNPPVAAKATPSESAEILGILRGMDARLRKLEGSPAPAAPPANPPVALPGPKAAPVAPGLLALGAKCAACHESKVSADKGGGLTLFDGNALAKLTDRQIRRVISVTQKQPDQSGVMPPKDNAAKVPPITDAEASAIVALFDQK